MEERYKIEIVNVVVSAEIGKNIDLNKIANEVKDAEYKHKQFPGLVLRVKDPKAATLIFRSGKVICTGSKSVEEANRAVRQAVKIISKLGIPVSLEPEVKVQNLVATADLGVFFNLHAIAIGLGLENIEYEPEQFPGLIYRLNKPRVVMLVFPSGKIVITGGKSVEAVVKAVEVISEELSSIGLMD